jgi:hypothetical protein
METTTLKQTDYEGTTDAGSCAVWQFARPKNVTALSPSWCSTPARCGVSCTADVCDTFFWLEMARSDRCLVRFISMISRLGWHMGRFQQGRVGGRKQCGYVGGKIHGQVAGGFARPAHMLPVVNFNANALHEPGLLDMQNKIRQLYRYPSALHYQNSVEITIRNARSEKEIGKNGL